MCERWSDELVSPVDGLTYDFNNHTGRLDMPRGCNCDMGGCVDLFQRIDPHVKLIETYSGSKPDTVYRREGREWKAYERQMTRQENPSQAGDSAGAALVNWRDKKEIKPHVTTKRE
jgi:hypothetical protein